MQRWKIILRIVVTLLMVTVAVVLGTLVWQHYMRDPWTRDARVRAETIDLAPDISGPIVEMRVKDNQAVEKGQLLFRVDPERHRVAVQQAEATVDARRIEMEQRATESRRRSQLAENAISTEERQRAASTAAMAAAAFAEAQAQLAAARLNLERADVKAPVAGFVTNLRAQAGDYATAGKAVFALIDRDSFRVDGYFEETKLPAIREGQRAEIWLMGEKRQLDGHVESISRAIADKSGTADPELLADVSPTFNWVRLAQRIPVRIHLDRVPDGVRLSAGMTATVIVRP